MADGPEIGAVGIAFNKIGGDLDRLVEIGLGIGEAALERAGKSALRVGSRKRPAAHVAGFNHRRTARDGFVRRGLAARARGLLRYQLGV